MSAEDSIATVRKLLAIADDDQALHVRREQSLRLANTYALLAIAEALQPEVRTVAEVRLADDGDDLPPAYAVRGVTGASDRCRHNRWVIWLGATGADAGRWLHAHADGPLNATCDLGPAR